MVSKFLTEQSVGSGIAKRNKNWGSMFVANKAEPAKEQVDYKLENKG